MTRHRPAPFLIGLLSALYFSGAQASALIVPKPKPQITKLLIPRKS